METISDFCDVHRFNEFYQEFYDYTQLSYVDLLNRLVQDGIIGDANETLNEFCNSFKFGVQGAFLTSNTKSKHKTFESVDKKSNDDLLEYIRDKNKEKNLKTELIKKYKASFLKRLILIFKRIPLQAILNDESDLIDKFSFIKTLTDDESIRQRKVVNTISFLESVICENDKKYIDKRLFVIIESFEDYFNALKYYKTTTDQPHVRVQKVVSSIIFPSESFSFFTLPIIFGSSFNRFNSLESDVNDYLAEHLTRFLIDKFPNIELADIYDIILSFTKIDVRQRIKKLKLIISVCDFLIENDKSSVFNKIYEYQLKVQQIDKKLHEEIIPQKIEKLRGPFDYSNHSSTHEKNLEEADKRVVALNSMKFSKAFKYEVMVNLGIKDDFHNSNSALSIAFNEFISLENHVLESIISNNISFFSSAFVRFSKEFNSQKELEFLFQLIRNVKDQIKESRLDDFIKFIENLLKCNLTGSSSFNNHFFKSSFTLLCKDEVLFKFIESNPKTNFMDFVVSVFNLPGFCLSKSLPVVLLEFFKSHSENYQDIFLLIKLVFDGNLNLNFIRERGFCDLFRMSFTQDFFIRIAKILIFRNFFDERFYEYESVVFSKHHDEKLLTYISSRNLRRRLIKNEYKASIDVHEDGRDTKTELGVSLMIESQNLSDEEAISEFDEFWEYSKSLPEESKKIFIRVMGFDHDMTPCSSKTTSDFDGFLTSDVNVKGKYINPKVVLGNFWKFSKEYKSEDIKSSLFSGIMMCYQKSVRDWYCVCNKGKLQYMTICVLQGRILYNDESGNTTTFLVDDVSDDFFAERRHDSDEDDLTPIQMYNKLLPFIKEISEFSRPKNANELFKELFIYANKNNLNQETACKVLCLYSQVGETFDINPEFSVAALFDGCFDLDEYIHLREQINFNVDDVEIEDVIDDDFDFRRNEVDDFEDANFGNGNVNLNVDNVNNRNNVIDDLEDDPLLDLEADENIETYDGVLPENIRNILDRLNR